MVYEESAKVITNSRSQYGLDKEFYWNASSQQKIEKLVKMVVYLEDRIKQLETRVGTVEGGTE